jgi:hypothetical protein
MKSLGATIAATSVLFSVVSRPADASPIDGCPVFRTDNIWNQRVDSAPVHAQSGQYIGSFGTATMFYDVSLDGSAGIPFVAVPGTQPPATFTCLDPGACDPGPYPIPPNAPISQPDQNVIVLDQDHCLLYELFMAAKQADGSWQAETGAIFNLRSDALRANGLVSANAAGLPTLPGLLRYDEVASGVIDHALLVITPTPGNTYVWPARFAGDSPSVPPNRPPWGSRLRLKQSYDISGFSTVNQVVLTALKRYGAMIFNGTQTNHVFLETVPDSRWTISNEIQSISRLGVRSRGCQRLPAVARFGRRARGLCTRAAALGRRCGGPRPARGRRQGRARLLAASPTPH